MMFKIEPLCDDNLAKKITEDAGVEYKEGFFFYHMYELDGGKTLGHSQFEILGTEGYIYSLSPASGVNDDEAMFILARQTMNFLEGCGAYECYANPKIDNALLKKVGFKEISGKFFCNTKGMFDGHCGCKG
jgi:hypothetical protein